MNNETMDLLKDFARHKEIASALKEQADAVLREFKMSASYKELEDGLARHKEAQSILREAIEHSALETYAEEGEKKMFEGFVGIRVTKQYKVGDSKLVRDWVMINAPLLLEVNNKGLVSMAKSSALPEYVVSLEEVSKVTIASDLSSLLEVSE